MKLILPVACVFVVFTTITWAQEKSGNDPLYDAGYQWAEDHDIQSPDECSNKSKAFIDGCRAWIGDEPSEDDEIENEED